MNKPGALLRRGNVVGVPPASRGEIVLLSAILLGGLAARLYHLGVPTLTSDEWFMLRSAHEGAAWIINQARSFEPHPLLYYLGFWAWVRAAGETEWAMRLPSVLFGVLTVVACWRIARDVAGPGVGLGAAMLAAINPYQVAQSQNARNYAMVAALSAVATVLFLVASRRGGAAWTPYTVVMLLALHTHLNALLIALAHGLWLSIGCLTRREWPEREALRAVGIVALLFVPWLIYAAPALTAYQGYFPERVGPVEVAVRTIGTFFFGQAETPRRLLIVVTGALVAFSSVWLVVRARLVDGGTLLVLTAGVPLALSAALFLVRPIFEERYLIVAAPSFVALLAIGAALLGRPHPAVGLAALGWLAILTGPFLERYYPAVVAERPNWRGLAGWIASEERPGDIVLITGHGVAEAYSYYGRARSPVALAADETAAASDLDAALATKPNGIFHLPLLESRPDRIAHDRLVTMGFAGETRWFRGQRVQYVALPSEDAAPPTILGARWLNAIELVSASVSPPSARPGDAARIELMWRALGPAPALKISLRLRGPSGEGVGQLDRQPIDGARPFNTLALGETIRDGHALRVPADAPLGVYSVSLLLYQPAEAWPVPPSADRSLLAPDNTDLVRIGTVEVTQ